MSFPPATLLPLATELVLLLKSRKETISLVESTTGGLIASTILSLPGTSAVFAGGVMAYSLKSRKAFAEWKDEMSNSYDGPTEKIVLHLARSVQKQVDSTYALAESAVAGPTLPSVYRKEIDRPGYCPLGVVAKDGNEWSRTVRVDGDGKDRAGYMVAFAEEGLKMLLDVVKGKAAEEGKDGKL